MYNKNKILITGGAGYIGSHIVELLIKNNKKVFIFDNLITGYKKLINKKAKFIRGDIKNLSKLSKTIKENNINSVIHLAAYLNINESEKYKKKYYKNNVGGTLNLVKACRGTNVKNIVFSSSCSIYGNTKGSVDERKKPNPKSYYAFTKYKSEEIIKKYSKKYNFRYGILRYFNVAGASKSGKIGEIEKSHGHLIKNLAIQSTKLNPKVNIFGNNYNTRDGTCIRDYIHVSDLAEIHILALKKISNNKKSLILNCGYGKGYSVKEIVDIFLKIKKNVVIRYQKKRRNDIAHIYANITKLKKILKWKPKYNNIYLILKSAIKWEKKINKKFLNV